MLCVTGMPLRNDTILIAFALIGRVLFLIRQKDLYGRADGKDGTVPHLQQPPAVIFLQTS